VLALAALGSAAIFGELVALLEFGNFLFEIHAGKDYSGVGLNPLSSAGMLSNPTPDNNRLAV
jgi:hypothetical protein